MPKIKELSFLVYGLGISGKSVIRYFKKNGIKKFEIWDDEGDSFEFSDAGKEFIATNESINDDGWLEAYSDGASEDFIYDLQNEWQLSLRKD